MKVLLVEDTSADALLFSDALSSAGIEVSHFKDGDVFCDSLSKLAEDGVTDCVLVLDLVMPGMDGYEVVREVGKTGLKIPTILVTGQDPSYLKTFRLLTEAHGIPILADFKKPVKIADLVAAVRKAGEKT